MQQNIITHTNYSPLYKCSRTVSWYGKLLKTKQEAIRQTTGSLHKIKPCSLQYNIHKEWFWRTDSPWFMMVRHDFSILQCCGGYRGSRETTLWILNFDLSLGWQQVVWCCLVLPGREPQPPAGYRTTKVNNQHNYNHSGPMQPLYFSLSVQYSVRYMRYSMLYYKTDFVLSDFAQICVEWLAKKANASILSMFKVG